MAGVFRKEDCRLTYIRYVGVKKYKSYALYRCSCGTVKVLQRSRVNLGETRSCGCLKVVGNRDPIVEMEIRGR